MNGDKPQKGKGYDGPLLPAMAAGVVKTSGKGTPFLTAADHAEASRHHADTFRPRVLEALRENLLKANGEEAGELQRLYEAIDRGWFAAYFRPLPHAMREWLIQADRFRLRFYFAWCLMQAKLGKPMPQHYLDVLRLNCPADIFTGGDWSVFFTELAQQVKQKEAEQAAQAA